MISQTVSASTLRTIALLGFGLALAGCTGGSGASLVPSSGSGSGTTDQAVAGPGGSTQRTLPIEIGGGGGVQHIVVQ